MSHKDEFIGFLSRSITEMHQDVKILFEMFDDAEFSDEARKRAVGALVYMLAPGDLIPDTFGLVGQVDDSLVFRMTMQHLVRVRPERRAHYSKRYPEVFDTMDEDLRIAANYLEDLYPFMEQWLDRLETLEFKGKTPQVFLEDVEASSWLYDEINEALLDLEFDEDELNRELRRVERILPVIREKMDSTRR